MKVVFLDIDGVLNSARRWKILPAVEGGALGNKIDTEAVARLNHIAYDCSVVVSSSWRFCFTPEELRECLLPFGLDPAIPFIDSTQRGGDGHRGKEILDWLHDHPDVTGFVVLDDDNDMDGVRHRFVKTSWDLGLLDGHVKLARRALEKPKAL